VSKIDAILSDICSLSADEKLQLIDKILISLHPVNRGVETTNLKEAEERMEAYDKGLLDTVDEKDVFSKYA